MRVERSLSFVEPGKLHLVSVNLREFAAMDDNGAMISAMAWVSL